jgi:hypothetical protein
LQEQNELIVQKPEKPKGRSGFLVSRHRKIEGLRLLSAYEKFIITGRNVLIIVEYKNIIVANIKQNLVLVAEFNTHLTGVWRFFNL